MAERKSGPVKPPVIDLNAREASETEGGGGGRLRARTARRGSKPASPAKSSPATPQSAPATAEAAPADRDTTKTEKAAPAMTTAENPAGTTAAATKSPPRTDQAEARSSRTPPPPRPPARLAMPWSAISIATVAGGVIGAGLTYLLANWIALPTKAPPFEDPTPALTQLAQADADLAERLAAVETTARRTQVSLDATLVQLDNLDAALRQSIADLRTAIPEPQAPIDLGALEARIETLDARVTAIAAGASSDDAAALAASLGNIEQSLATLETGLGQMDQRVAAADSDLASLRNELDDAKAAIAAQTRSLAGADIGPAVRLPLIVSGLEAAFGNGRPYEAELSGLTALLPDLEVPPSVAARAESGLPRPDAIYTRFEDRLPAILAGRTAQSTGDLTQDAIEWAKALLALRPAEEMEGSTPEAIISRLEGSLERRDFSAAAALLAQLSDPMREAAGELAGDILALADAERFVSGLRTQALTPAEPSP